MGYRYGSRSFRDALSYEWRSTTKGLRERKKAWAIGFVSVSLLFALIFGITVRPSLTDMPLVLLAGFLQSLRFLSLFAFIWFWVVAYLVHGAIQGWAEDRWIDRERIKKPGESFPVPYLRFWVLALIPSAIVFLVPSVLLGYLLFVLPNNIPVLDQALSVFLSGEE